MEEIPLSSPDITEVEVDAVTRVLQSDRLVLGPFAERFEAACAIRSKRGYGIAVSSGTAGLHLCVRALEIGDGHEVITTPFSFVASTNCILFEDAVPVFVDIDDETWNMDPAAVEAAITPNTRGILAVEVFANMAHFEDYERIASEKNLHLIEDCCEALGSHVGARPAGSFGAASVFAFYPNKQITTGEGGMIVTDSREIRDLCVSMRNQGRDTEDWHSHARLGFNYRMSELSAALGAAQMERLDEIVGARRRAAGLYDDALCRLVDKGLISLPPMAARDSAAWFVYVIRLSDDFTLDDREQIIRYMHSEGVGCSRYFPPIHLQPYISEILGTKKGDFPKTEDLAQHTIALPFYSGLTSSQVMRVEEVLSAAISSAGSEG
jgi:perosamine synthetase